MYTAPILFVDRRFTAKCSSAQLYGSQAADLRVTHVLDVVGILDLSTTTEEYATGTVPEAWAIFSVHGKHSLVCFL